MALAPPCRYFRSHEVVNRLDVMLYGVPVLPVRLRHWERVQ